MLRSICFICLLMVLSLSANATNMSKEEIDNYLSQDSSKLDLIEGIWTYSKIEDSELDATLNEFDETTKHINMKGYKVAILKDPSYADRYSVIGYESLKQNIDVGKGRGYFYVTMSTREFQYIYNPDVKKKHWITFTLLDNNDRLYSMSESEIDFGKIGTVIIKNEELYVKYIPTKVHIVESKSDICSGSGSIISESGLVVTNYHVIKNASNIIVYIPQIGKEFQANLILKDKNNDLAILKLQDFEFSKISSTPIPFVILSSSNSKVGEDIFTLGFPLGEILGKTSKFSSGKINSLFGIDDDPRVYQISNPIQPGNSGGGLFNSNGEFIGVVFSSLNAKFFYENANIIPQNVNFAIKSNYLLNLISLLPDEKKILSRKNSLLELPVEKQIELIKPFIVNIKAR